MKEKTIRRHTPDQVTRAYLTGAFTLPRGKKAHPRKFVQLRPVGIWFLFSRWRG